MKVIITDCDHTSIDIEKKIFNEANLEFELKQCKTEEDLINQCKDGDTSQFENGSTLWSWRK